MTGLGQGKKYWSAVCFQTFKKLGLEKTPTMSFFPTNPLLHDRKTWILVPFVWPLFGRFDFKFLWPKKISTIRSRWKSVNPCLSLINQLNCWKRNNPSFSTQVFWTQLSLLSSHLLLGFKHLLKSTLLSSWQWGEEMHAPGKKAWLRGFEPSLVP